jgi:hypothetical protein
MKKQTLLFLLISILITGLSSCQVVEGIFKAGMIWGIILVLAVIFGILYLISRGRGK